MATSPVSYTSIARVNSAYPALSSVTAITSAILHQYAGDVEAEINGVISRRYALPLTADCPLLTALATRETIYRVTVQRALIQFPPAQQGRHPLQQQHLDDQKLLERIADGAVQLVTVTSAGVFSAVQAADLTQMEIYSTTMDYTPTFSEGAAGDNIQDQDKLDDDLRNRGLL